MSVRSVSPVPPPRCTNWARLLFSTRTTSGRSSPAVSARRIAWRDVVVTRTGYTGEPVAFESFVASEQAEAVWTALVDDRRIDQMVQVVLVGSPDLEANLCKRSARALAEIRRAGKGPGA